MKITLFIVTLRFFAHPVYIRKNPLTSYVTPYIINFLLISINILFCDFKMLNIKADRKQKEK